MAIIEFECFECHTQLEFSDHVERRAECSKCGADARVCKNCRHYDINAYNECKEPSADYVKEKDRSNFCEYFTPNTAGHSKGPGRNDLLKAAEALFKKK